METTHTSLPLDKLSLKQINIMGIPTSFIQIIILFDEAFKHSDGANFQCHVGRNAETVSDLFSNFYLKCHSFVNYFKSSINNTRK